MVNPANIDRRIRDSSRRQITSSTTQTLTNFSDEQVIVCTGTTTLTLPAPSAAGITVTLIQLGAGTTSVVLGAGFNAAGNTTAALDSDKDSITVKSWYDTVSLTYKWTLVCNNGATLS